LAHRQGIGLVKYGTVWFAADVNPSRPLTSATSPVRQSDSLPLGVLALASVHRIDYVDAFRTSRSGTRRWSATRWSRHVLEGAPILTRARLVGGWLSLGLDINPLRRDRVLGWHIASSSKEHVTLSADSRIGINAELVFAGVGDTWWFGTVLSLDTAAARTAWSAIEATHLRVVAALLQDAVDRREAWAQGAVTRDDAG